MRQYKSCAFKNTTFEVYCFQRQTMKNKNRPGSGRSTGRRMIRESILLMLLYLESYTLHVLLADIDNHRFLVER
jgi:hypothetical protein